MGIRFIIYLDDILIMGESPEEVQRHLKIVTELFISVGFIINWAKSEVSPSPLDLPTLVSTSDRDGSRNAARVQIAPDSITLQSVGASSSSAIREIPSVRLEFIRQRLVLRGFSSEVIEMLLASSRRPTVASYQSAWNNWLRWNLARGSDPLSNTLSIVLQYLTELFSSGLASSTINLHRSVLSMTLEPLEGHNIGEHPLVVQLLKGIFNSKPPRPRYDVLWDPDDVIQFFMSAKDNAYLSFAVLSYKLVTLIALASLLRVSDFGLFFFPSHPLVFPLRLQIFQSLVGVRIRVKGRYVRSFCPG
jgi:hypothetical protein